MPPEVKLLIGMFIFVVIVLRLAAGSIDGERVERYLKERGLKLVDRSWDPFGPGWFGEKDSRIYKIIYEDEEGRTHRAHVKTSMMSGVYLTNDEIVEEKPKRASRQSLVEEKAGLEKRLREIDRELKGSDRNER